MWDGPESKLKSFPIRLIRRFQGFGREGNCEGVVLITVQATDAKEVRVGGPCRRNVPLPELKSGCSANSGLFFAKASPYWFGGRSTANNSGPKTVLFLKNRTE